MSWLLERPWTIGLTGAVLFAVIAFFWLQTGHRRLFQLGLAVFVVFGILVGVERAVVTDREQVAATLHHLAALLEANEKAALLEYFHPSSVDRTKAEEVLADYDFDYARIKQNLQIETENKAERRFATATFNGVASLTKDVGRISANQNIARFFTLELEYEQGLWRIVSYKHEDAMKGLQKRDP